MTKKNRAKVRRALLSISLVLVLMMAAVGGTIAWLTDTTEAVENTFTVGNIDIDLKETPNTDADGDNTKDSWTAKLIPKHEYEKDPEVTVKAGSEECYLFVKADVPTGNQNTVNGKEILDFELFAVDDEGNLKTITVPAANDTTVTKTWAQVPGETDVWYITIDMSEVTGDFTFSLLEGDKVTVNEQLTNADNKKIKDDNYDLTMTFQAYAVQVDNRTVDEAWSVAKATTAADEFETGTGHDGFGVPDSNN